MKKPRTLSKTTITFHWTVAICIAFLLAVGAYMALTSAWGLYDIHKSVGLLMIPLLLARVVWRFKEGWPKPLNVYTDIEQKFSKAIHWTLLLGILAMPLTGMLYSGASGHGFGIFGLTLLPENHDTSQPGQVVPHSTTLTVIGETAHEWLGYGFMAILALHIAGAIKHHLVNRDGTLRRMLGRPA